MFMQTVRWPVLHAFPEIQPESTPPERRIKTKIPAQTLLGGELHA